MLLDINVLEFAKIAHIKSDRRNFLSDEYDLSDAKHKKRNKGSRNKIKRKYIKAKKINLSKKFKRNEIVYRKKLKNRSSSIEII
jgi:hypothetical protein